MSFQFRCPSGCLLEGEPNQAGSTIACPVCGQMFIIPAPAAAQPANPAPPTPAQPAAPQATAPQLMTPQPMTPPAPAPATPAMAQPLPAQQPQSQPHAPQPAAPNSPQTAAGNDASPADSGQAGIKTSPAARILSDSYKTLHFPCTCGQWVEAPRELAGQQATCPHCHQPLLLQETASREYLEAVEIARRRREARIGNAWLNWAIAFAIFVLLGLAALIIKSQLDN